ncbi:MAG: tetratricopeptide repeat protein [Pseudomonadota bacterium]|nr:tetratricopeptide repeat protein [Pseudomonadota bacterium]
MDEFLSEKEQLEGIRQWWRDNGWYLVGAVTLGATVLVGWNQWTAYEQRQAESAATLYQELQAAAIDDFDSEAADHLEQLRTDYASTPYADQGGLLMARVYLENNNIQLAGDELRYVMERSTDAELALVARLRLARVLAYEEAYQEALALLDMDAGMFSGRYNEVRGDIHVALGNPDSARLAYAQALTTGDSEMIDRVLVQMKLDDLPAVSSPDPEINP